MYADETIKGSLIWRSRRGMNATAISYFRDRREWLEVIGISRVLLGGLYRDVCQPIPDSVQLRPRLRLPDLTQHIGGATNGP
jgi:hypothetical protein